VAVRQAALVSDESALEARFTTMRYTNWRPLPFTNYFGHCLVQMVDI